MKRRNFLQFLGLGTAVVAIPGISFASNNFSDSVKGLIKNELHYLKLDEEGLEAFVKEFFPQNSGSEKAKIKMLYMFRLTSKTSYTVEKITRNYLLGTDFFRNKMDESKTVHYTGLYNSYRMPCGHPFNNIYYPEKMS